MLGQRQPEVYGHTTLDDISDMCIKTAENKGWSVDFRQSNSEADLITWIQQARGIADAVIINPAAYTHTSIAIMDALLLLEVPVIEVHLSNIHQREDFRHISYVSKVAKGVIAGFGAQGYLMALNALETM